MQAPRSERGTCIWQKGQVRWGMYPAFHPSTR